MILNRKFLIIIFIVLIGIFAFWFVKDQGYFQKANTNLYYAVFLTNGQVYFGNLERNTDDQFILTNVYYLQLEGGGDDLQAQLSESRFSLIKMGNEVHGPTDELFINKENILFYEKLRDDSKVVESIKQSQS